MRSLFDVNMLLAMFDTSHVHHELAMSWWALNSEYGWAICPLSENGFLRIISQRLYAHPVPLATAMALLDAQAAASDHAFRADEVSILDRELVDRSRLLGPRQIADLYLLALAVKNGGRFVTLDRGIVVSGVKGAPPEALAVVG